jgi:hypothetical protein
MGPSVQLLYQCNRLHIQHNLPDQSILLRGVVRVCSSCLRAAKFLLTENRKESTQSSVDLSVHGVTIAGRLQATRFVDGYADMDAKKGPPWLDTV